MQDKMKKILVLFFAKQIQDKSSKINQISEITRA